MDCATRVTDRFAELCIWRCRSLSVLVGRMLFMIRVHAYWEPSSISTTYTILSSRSDALFEYLSSWMILKLDTKHSFSLGLFGRSLSVSYLWDHRAFSNLSSESLCHWGTSLLRSWPGSNLFGTRCLNAIWVADIVGLCRTFHSLFNICYYDFA